MQHLPSLYDYEYMVRGRPSSLEHLPPSQVSPYGIPYNPSRPRSPGRLSPSRVATRPQVTTQQVLDDIKSFRDQAQQTIDQLNELENMIRQGSRDTSLMDSIPDLEDQSDARDTLFGQLRRYTYYG